MAWTEQTPFGAFGHAPELRAAPIGDVASAIMRQRQFEQANMQKQFSDLAETIAKQKAANAFIEQAQAQGLPTAGEGIYGAAGTKTLADLVREKAAEESLANYRDILGGAAQTRADRPSAGGVPRYEYKGVLLTGEQYRKALQQDEVTKNYGALSAQEAQATAKASQYEKRYGVDTEAGGLKAPGMFADQPTKDQFAKDQADYFSAVQERARIRKQRENYEKWYRGVIQTPGGAEPGANTEEEEPLPQTSSTTAPGIKQPDVDQARQALASPSPSPASIPYDQTIPAGPSAPPPTKVNPPAVGGIAPSYDKAQPGQHYRAPDGSIRLRSG